MPRGMPVAVKNRKNAGPMSTVYSSPAGSYTQRSQSPSDGPVAVAEEVMREAVRETLFISSSTSIRDSFRIEIRGEE